MRRCGWVRGAWLGLGFAGAALFSGGCGDALGGAGDGGGLGIGGLSGIGGTFTIDVSVRTVLAALFPELTAEELDELAASFTLEAALELETEIEEMRAEAEVLGDALFTSAEERVETRTTDLADANGGFPVSLEPIAATAFQSQASGEAYVELGGVMTDRSAVLLASGDVTVTVDGAATAHQLACFHDGEPVDIVFLVDVTGSMSPVIGSVRRSLQAFVDGIVASNVTGTLGVVTFQDTVGVNLTFQEPSDGIERSPFFLPVSIDDSAGIERLQRFITRLEADSGADLPENLAGAVDFANRGVIGDTASGEPNVIGDGVEDPPGTAPWPSLGAERRIFVALTDSTFHSDSRTPSNSSLEAGFEPRSIADITADLRAAGAVVHVSDPSWLDETQTPTGASSESEVDADYWAKVTGGVGEDRVLGYSLTDLELVVVAETTGLLDIALSSIIASSCRVELPGTTLTATSTVSLTLSQAGESSTRTLAPVVY